jgi:hypothetical protein
MKILRILLEKFCEISLVGITTDHGRPQTFFPGEGKKFQGGGGNLLFA